MMDVISTGYLIFNCICILFAAFLGVYVYFKQSYHYWRKKGVPYLEPKFPYGNNPFLFPKTTTFSHETTHWYRELKKQGLKFGGVYSFSKKVLVITDPDYVKDILSKDFQYFCDRDLYSNQDRDPIGTHLINIKAPNWKQLRQKITPTFTIGKIKSMFQSVYSCSHDMVKFLDQSNSQEAAVDIREVFSCYTTDVICSVAYGINCHSFVQTSSEFRTHGRNFFKPDLELLIKVCCIRYFPQLSQKLGLRMGKRKTLAFFAEIVKDLVYHRRNNNMRRSDFLQTLIDINNETNVNQKAFSFEEMVSNTAIFFIAGFDTTSTVMIYAMYELAKHPNIQQKAREEILHVLQKHDGQMTYEAVQEMTYLKQIIEETLRIHPPIIMISRMCTKDYRLRDTDITIEAGTAIIISVQGMTSDPEYFPEPTKFDPDRFSSENVANRHPFLHIPFGEGPRICVGIRLGLMITAIGLARVLKHFKFSLSSKTKEPLDYDQKLFILKEKHKIYLNVEKV